MIIFFFVMRDKSNMSYTVDLARVESKIFFLLPFKSLLQ